MVGVLALLVIAAIFALAVWHLSRMRTGSIQTRYGVVDRVQNPVQWRILLLSGWLLVAMTALMLVTLIPGFLTSTFR